MLSSASNPGGLTSSEREVLLLVCEGYSNKSIASILQRSPHTIAVHAGALYSKTGAETKVGLYKWAMAHGLVSVPDVVLQTQNHIDKLQEILEMAHKQVSDGAE